MEKTRRWRWMALTSTLTLIQIGAVIHALRVPPALAEQVSLVLPLELAAGAVWALLFAGLTVNLVREQHTRWAGAAVAGWVLYNTARLLLFVQADYDQGRLPFFVILTLLAVLAVAWPRR
jgi:hypothetical protein